MGVRGSRASLFLCFFQKFPVKLHFSSGLWRGQGSGPPFEGTSSLRFHYVWEYINRTQRDNGQWSENPTASWLVQPRKGHHNMRSHVAHVTAYLEGQGDL